MLYSKLAQSTTPPPPPPKKMHESNIVIGLPLLGVGRNATKKVL